METTGKWYLTRQTFPELLHRNVVRFPDRVAQKWRARDGQIREVCYRELGTIVHEMAAGLMALGLDRGDRVAILSETRPEWMWADYAIACAGGISVAVHVELSLEESLRQIVDSGSRMALVRDPELCRRIRDAAPACLEQVVCLGPGDGLTLDELRAFGREGMRLHPLALGQVWRAIQPDDPMTIIYTSGTTGPPKGVVHTHRSLNAGCIRDLSGIGILTEDDLLLSVLPISHSFERQCGHGTAMTAAVPIAYASPQTLFQDLQTFRPTYMMTVPGILGHLMDLARRPLAARMPEALLLRAFKQAEGTIDRMEQRIGFVNAARSRNLSLGFGRGLVTGFWDVAALRHVRQAFGGRIRFLFSSGSGLSPELCKRYLAVGIPILEGYGLTETSNTVMLNRKESIRPGSVGSPMRRMEYRFSEDGELLVKGDMLFSGYWNRPEETAAVMDADGYFRTGDIIRKESGFFVLEERKGGRIVLDSGENVSVEKVERAFAGRRYVTNVIPVGDNRAHVGVLVVPDFDVMAKMFIRNGIAFKDESLIYRNGICVAVGDDFLAIPEVRTFIEMEIRDVNENLEPHEQIRGYALLARRLSIAGGELTPTLKVRRRRALEKHAVRIAEIYDL